MKREVGLEMTKTKLGLLPLLGSIKTDIGEANCSSSNKVILGWVSMVALKLIEGFVAFASLSVPIAIVC